MFYSVDYKVTLANQLNVEVHVEIAKSSIEDDEIDFPNIENCLEVSFEITDKNDIRERTDLMPIDFLKEGYCNNDDVPAFLKNYGIKDEYDFEEKLVHHCINHSKEFDEAMDRLIKEINEDSDK